MSIIGDSLKKAQQNLILRSPSGSEHIQRTELLQKVFSAILIAALFLIVFEAHSRLSKEGEIMSQITTLQNQMAAFSQFTDEANASGADAASRIFSQLESMKSEIASLSGRIDVLVGERKGDSEELARMRERAIGLSERLYEIENDQLKLSLEVGRLNEEKRLSNLIAAKE